MESHSHSNTLTHFVPGTKSRPVGMDGTERQINLKSTWMSLLVIRVIFSLFEENFDAHTRPPRLIQFVVILFWKCGGKFRTTEYNRNHMKLCFENKTKMTCSWTHRPSTKSARSRHWFRCEFFRARLFHNSMFYERHKVPSLTFRPTKR